MYFYMHVYAYTYISYYEASDICVAAGTMHIS